ncbi:hypothetical protein SORBI_3006G031500 [Sorghum bicolor]|uniref:Plant heme peroxidase family profile domain-containing protein n=1 Tax=Sorghum bicolor TaxID=4558 RepID=A0A1B6PJS9_SORBI|nr:hypothetical protein SORBI_3006G031500 [Sorghum bicolor]
MALSCLDLSFQTLVTAPVSFPPRIFIPTAAEVRAELFLDAAQGCDASVLLSGPDDEHSASADTTLCTGRAGPRHPRQGRASTPTPKCAYKVSCADILALAGRDVVS